MEIAPAYVDVTIERIQRTYGIPAICAKIGKLYNQIKLEMKDAQNEQ